MQYVVYVFNIYHKLIIDENISQRIVIITSFATRPVPHPTSNILTSVFPAINGNNHWNIISLYIVKNGFLLRNMQNTPTL